jgi:DNA-binding transcriptional LysR family regulator
VAKTSYDGSRVELVKSGLGLSFCEAEMASNHTQAVKVLPQLDFETELHFVVAKQRADEPVIKALLQEMRVLWNIALK